MTPRPETPPTGTLAHLRGLLEVTELVRTHAALPELLDAIARTISEALGYGSVVVNLFRPAWDDFEVVAVHGTAEARETLLGVTTSSPSWQRYFDDRFARGGAYLIPEELRDWEDGDAHVPPLEPLDDPDAWRAEDTLVVPLLHSDGHVLGIISVDEPESRLRPGDDDLAVLAAVADHVAGAIESAQAGAEADRVRVALARLLAISSRLAELPAPEAMLDLVAAGIRDALGFEKVVVAIADGRGGFVPGGTAGWDEGAPELDFTHTREEVHALLVPEFEIEGCYLLAREQALARTKPGSSHVSVRNGRGPRAWNRHWLLVPLLDREGTLLGFVWADDPEDHLLPSPERLSVLRTFANHAAAALHAADDFRTVARRNGELAALHGTTLALLDRLELDNVLEAIVENARALVGTTIGYIYLVDRDADLLRLRVQRGASTDDVRGITLARGEGLAGRVWESGESYSVTDYATWSGRRRHGMWGELHATLGVPLRVDGEVVGVLGVSSAETERVFRRGDVLLLERFAQLASLALQNARLFEELRRSGELHRLVVEGSSDLIFVLDAAGRFLFVSPAAQRVTGYDAQELVDTTYHDYVHPDDLALVIEAMTTAVQEGRVTPTVARVRHKDGEWGVLEATPSAIRGEGGEIDAIVVVARDVSSRIREEEARLRLEEQLRQAQKMESIGLLAGGIAHDFNNLLTAIGGYAELGLLELPPDAPARESIEQVARAAHRAAELTGQLLAFSRKQVLRPRVLDLNEVVQQMATMLTRVLGENVVLSTALESEIGTVRADPTQVEQVLLNLAINARDAMPNGGNLIIRTGELEVAADGAAPHPDLAPGAYATISVRDSGVGMTPELAERIFEPFFTTKDVGEGTGLGLATVHGIVSQSGGAIWVESEPGAGTCFTVCLPRS